MDISAATFKAECLKLMDQVEKTRKPIVITKHGRPVAQLAPIPTEPRSLFGYMRNSVAIQGEITASLGEEWSALSGDEDHLYKQPARKSKRPKK